MKKFPYFIAFFVLISICALSVSGQQSGSEGELTIEEVYLQNAEIRIIREQALSEDRGMKLLALDNIQAMLDEGKLSTGAPDAHLILDYLAGEGLIRMVRENQRLVNYYPEVRRRAAEILGQLGGEKSKDTLLNVLRSDIEPMVLAETVYALGKIGINENNQTSQIIAATLLAQDAVNPDDNFAFASLLAFEKLADANGGLTDSTALEAVVRMAQGNYNRTVKQKAFQVLENLRKY
jgi:hypothetical protein